MTAPAPPPTNELYCNQRRLGPPLFAALRGMLDSPQPPEIVGFLEQGSVGVENQSCAIASMATAINLLLGKPVLSLETTPKIVRKLLEYHNKFTVLNADGWQPWQVFNRAGPRYHSLATVAQACGLDARVVWYPLPNSPVILPFQAVLRHIHDGGVASVSVRNKFAGEVTKSSYSTNDTVGHIITICRVSEASDPNPQNWTLEVADPVADINAPPTMTIPADTLLRYSMAGTRTVRGVIYDARAGMLDDFAPFQPP
ncbi:MAG TPA: hypothetical protein VNG90_00595, partial [Candidatus Acidoferrum sp.]|nr:hypothetical protein [Candidatus Acidoferrum sp.]